MGIDKHAMAVVHPDAQIGEGTTIGPFALIEAGVVIGENCWIGPHAIIMSGTQMGDHCRVFPGAVVGGIPQDLKYKNEPTQCIIGSHTTIRECATVNKGTVAAMKTEVGSHCLIMAYAHIAHDCILGDHVILANSVNLAGHVLIDDWAILEGYVGVSQFVHIGAHSFISGQSGVRMNVPPFVKAAREPLSFVGVNTVGLSRRGYTKEVIEEIQEIYRLLYVKCSNITLGIKTIEKEIPASSTKTQILDFIQYSIQENKPGIMRGLRNAKAK